jgi:hypothetical protein
MNKKIIVGFIGISGSGKDTASDYLVNHFNFNKMSLATPVKKMAQECFLLTDEQCWGKQKEDIDERWGCSPREMFQTIGTEIGQYLLPDLIPSLKNKFQSKSLWVHHLYERIDKLKDAQYIVIADVRFKHEVDALLERGAYLFKITRPGLKPIKKHISEEEVCLIHNSKIFTLNNDGTLEELYEKLNGYFL